MTSDLPSGASRDDPRNWDGWETFQPLYRQAQPYTVVTPDRCWGVYSLATHAAQLEGHLYEAGVFRGGTAILLRHVLVNADHGDPGKRLRLFDTFAGMPETDPEHDWHRSGDFRDTDLETVRRTVGTDACISYHPGLIPSTFAGLEDDRICFAHIDVDLYKSVLDACAFIYPRLSAGGIMLFDDYGFPTCPGAKQAVDEFFADTPENPKILSTGQAVVAKL